MPDVIIVTSCPGSKVFFHCLMLPVLCWYSPLVLGPALPALMCFPPVWLPALPQCVAHVSNFLSSPTKHSFTLRSSTHTTILYKYLICPSIYVYVSMWNAEKYQDVLNHYTFVVIFSIQAIGLLWLFYTQRIRRYIAYCMSLALFR